MNTLSTAFHHTLHGIYFAENALIKALPKVASAATNVEFKALVQSHIVETKHQIAIVDKVFAAIT